LGVANTAPYGWRGEDATLEIHVRKTLESLFQHQPTPEELSDLVAYLNSLAPPKSQPPQTADDKCRVADGQLIFRGIGQCARCHSGESLQDGRRHDVGTGGMFDTPSLRGVRSRLALLHDGRVTQLESVFPSGSSANQNGGHGKFAELSKEEQADLLTYLRSL
jgi:cytochrome c peroxidase